MKRVLALLLFGFAFAPLSAHAQIAPFSTWVNERGSVLNVGTVDPGTGAFTGTYTNNAAGFGCQGYPYGVSGNAKGTAVNFVVNWKDAGAPDCRSITIWNGNIAGTQLVTRWTLDYVGADWQFHQSRGKDVFNRPDVAGPKPAAPPARPGSKTTNRPAVASKAD